MSAMSWGHNTARGARRTSADAVEYPVQGARSARPRRRAAAPPRRAAAAAATPPRRRRRALTLFSAPPRRATPPMRFRVGAAAGVGDGAHPLGLGPGAHPLVLKRGRSGGGKRSCNLAYRPTSSRRRLLTSPPPTPSPPASASPCSSSTKLASGSWPPSSARCRFPGASSPRPPLSRTCA